MIGTGNCLYVVDQDWALQTSWDRRLGMDTVGEESDGPAILKVISLEDHFTGASYSALWVPFEAAAAVAWECALLLARPTIKMKEEAANNAAN